MEHNGAVMDYYSMSDEAIAKELGHRLKVLRIRLNLSQDQLGESCDLSVSTIKRMESGTGKLSSFIAIMRALNSLGELDSFLPEPSISPMELYKNKNKRRQRASGARGSRKGDALGKSAIPNKEDPGW